MLRRHVRFHDQYVIIVKALFTKKLNLYNNICAYKIVTIVCGVKFCWIMTTRADNSALLIIVALQWHSGYDTKIDTIFLSWWFWVYELSWLLNRICGHTYRALVLLMTFWTYHLPFVVISKFIRSNSIFMFMLFTC